MEKILASFLGFLSIIGGLFTSHPQQLGNAVPATPALVNDYLATAITNTATSMTLANGKYRDGTPLLGYLCFTIDVNAPQVEYVCGTASSTSVTGLIRGISYSNPNATSSALAYAHNRLASVTITNYPQSEFVNRKINGVDTIDNGLYYTSSSPSFVTSSQQLVSKAYVDAYNSSSTFWTLSGSNMYSSLSGNVGIGTSSPVSKLSVVGNLLVNGNATTTGDRYTGGSATIIGTSTLGIVNASGLASFNGGMSSVGTTTLTGNINVTGTSTFIGVVNGVSKFGGTSADGALNVTSGTTTLDFASSTTLIKNYSSINISAGAVLNFTNASTSGSIAILKSTGNVTIAGTINLTGMGGKSDNNGTGLVVSTESGSKNINGVNYGGNGTRMTTLTSKGFSEPVYAGAGGGQGYDDYCGATSNGGTGGGGLVVESRGTLSFTGAIISTGSSGGVNSCNSGTATTAYRSGGGGGSATNGTSGTSGSNSGTKTFGGGGGGGGSALLLGNTLASTTGTFTMTGGAATSTSGTGGNGIGNIEQNLNF